MAARLQVGRPGRMGVQVSGARVLLRAQLWGMGSDCEWPGCGQWAVEMAHIHPRGMGHKGARDVMDNVMRACELHARVSDGLGQTHIVDREWRIVCDLPVSRGIMRDVLARRVKQQREAAGFDV